MQPIQQIFAALHGSICNLSISLTLVACAAGCAAAPESSPGGAALVAVTAAPAILASDSGDIAAARIAAARIAGDPGRARSVEPAAAAFLHGSPHGRAWLAAAAPRALARGEPGPRCPAIGVSAAPEASSAADAAGRALGRCLDQLSARGASADCGCRLLALDGALVAPMAEFAYAQGVGARLIGGDGAAGGRPLVALERGDSDPALTEVAFLDAGGVAAVAQLAEDGGARLLLFGDGEVYQGRREFRGWRRGRLTERLLLQGANGGRLIALIGFEPADVAAEGVGLGRWPARGRG
jgi:hypothetical protein